MRLSDEALADLFRSAESERIERKESINDPDKICQAICAFANDLPGSGLPGVIIIGQRDKDLTCAGLVIDTKLLEKIGGWRSTGKFQPFPVMSVERREIDGCVVAVVTVAPSENTPVRYEERIWIRVGPRRGTASAEEERRLTEKRRTQNLPFDARAVPDASLNDIDLIRFRLEYVPSAVPADVLAENGRSDEQQMRGLRLVDNRGIPTATALLILGKSPQDYFPGAYVQMLRIDGSQLTDDVIDRHELTGTLPDQLRRLDEVSDLWIQTATSIGDVARQDAPNYPVSALRQIFRNAIIHRNYEATNSPVRITWYGDRIEAQSPGGLFGQVTPETFGKPGVTDYRNPTLAEALYTLGFVERFGIGLQIVDNELQKNGNPPKEVEILPNFVQITVRRRF
ncbi:ATP-binding protein [Methyloferula stellata]|uniref:ATP-binding protein n=1 Tax=Methyloferula stellata TaxID=876270 RepID=UPI00035E061D|nr:ATP-binding protein [Methyloferula stellata]